MKRFFLFLFPFFSSCGCQNPDYVVGTWQSTGRLGWSCRNCAAAYKGRGHLLLPRKEVNQ